MARMLWYLLRVGILVLWHRWLEKPADPKEPFRLQRRAWPWYCDAYRHLNNAVYLRLAEDARWAWTARTPLFGLAVSSGWRFLVGGADLIYRREIPLLSRFEIVSRVIGADERWIYMAQEFVLPSGAIASRVLIRAMIRSRQGAVSPVDVAAAAGFSVPERNEEIERMQALGESQLAAIRDAGA